MLTGYTTATTLGRSHSDGDDRTRTDGLSVDNRLLFSSELRPLKNLKR